MTVQRRIGLVRWAAKKNKLEILAVLVASYQVIDYCMTRTIDRMPARLALFLDWCSASYWRTFA